MADSHFYNNRNFCFIEILNCFRTSPKVGASGSFPEVKWLGLEAALIPQSDVKVKNECGAKPPHSMHRDSFTLYFTATAFLVLILFPQEASYILCLDTVATSNSLYAHVSKPPREGSPGALFIKVCVCNSYV